MSTFVLIHGAWHGGWCWHKVVPLLRQRGHTVVAPDLPGHGIDRTPLPSVTLGAYAKRVVDILDATDEPVVLVGHSMGGVVISQAAELRPDRIRTMVYLAAAMARDGQTMFEVMQAIRSENVADNMVFSADQSSAGFKPESIRDIFYADCSDADVALAESVLTQQSLAPFAEPLRITPQNWGRVPRLYIECTQDNAIPLESQQQLHAQHPGTRVVRMNASHSPFFSAPEELVTHLLAL